MPRGFHADKGLRQMVINGDATTPSGNIELHYQVVADGGTGIQDDLETRKQNNDSSLNFNRPLNAIWNSSWASVKASEGVT